MIFLYLAIPETLLQDLSFHWTGNKFEVEIMSSNQFGELLVKLNNQQIIFPLEKVNFFIYFIFSN